MPDASTSRRGSRSSRSATTSERLPRHDCISKTLAVLRGGRRVLHDVSFSVTAGEALVLRGPNGAGKTTLLRTIAGYVRPADGQVRIEGVAPDATIGEQCHYVGHLNAVKAQLTVAENLDFWRRYLGDATADLDAILERLGLDAIADVAAAYLSAGQKRRLALARLLVAHRLVWLLDEPTVSLDADGTATLAAMAGEHCARGGLVIAATHIDLGIAGAREVRLAGRTEASWVLS